MTSPKKKLLFVTTISLGHEAGGTRYSKTIIDALAPMFDVRVLVLAENQKIGSRSLRWVLALLRAAVTGVPPNVIFHSGIINDEARRVLNETHELLVIDHLESACALGISEHEESLYISHNRESKLIARKLPTLLAPLAWLLAAWVDHFERRFLSKPSHIVSISSLDAEWYRQHHDHVEVVYPTFPAHGRNRKAAGSEGPLRVGFLGSANWKPNSVAVRTLFRKILPATERDVEIVLAGLGWDAPAARELAETVSRNHALEIRALGYVQDTSDFWSSIDLFAAPISTGAGVNVKVCEALANSVPVIAFPHALRGLDSAILSSGGINTVEDHLEFARAIETFDRDQWQVEPPADFSTDFAERKLRRLLSERPGA